MTSRALTVKRSNLMGLLEATSCRVPHAHHTLKPHCIHEGTVVQANNHRQAFRTSVLCATVRDMFWAFMIIVGCSEVVPGEAPVTLVRAVASVQPIRNCLKVAGGLYSQEKRDAAVNQVHVCYEEHFSPLKPLLRESRHQLLEKNKIEFHEKQLRT